MWKLLPLLAILANLILTVTSALCGNDKNSTFGCGINCGRRCSNYDKGPVTCAEKCNTNSCECKEGYVFDDYRGYCVKPEDCSNKDPSGPKGTEGTPENGEDEDTDTNPCDDCEKNCFAQGTTGPDGSKRRCTTEREGTKDPNAGDSSTSTMAARSKNSTVSQATNRSKRAIIKSNGNSSPSTKESEEGTTQNNEGEGVEESSLNSEKSEFSEEPHSSTDGSEMATVGPGSEATSGVSRKEATTGDSGMGSKTRKPKKTRRITTTASSKPDSSTSGLDVTTAGSVSEATISESRTDTSTEGSGSEATTGNFGIGSTRKQQKNRRKTTTASSGKPDSSTDVSKITTEGPVSEAMTGGTGMETSTEGSESEATTEYSEVGSKTRKPKKKRRKTTTASSGKPDSSTDVSKITTEEPESEATTSGFGMETTTEDSGLQATTGDSGMGSKTRKPKKKRKKTTTASSGKPDSSTDETKITTEEPESEATTGGTGVETTTEDSGSEATTGDSGMGSKTRKPKKKRRKTTTASSGKPDSSTDVSKITTEEPESEATTGGTGMEMTTEDSGLEATTGDSGMGFKTRKPKKKRKKTTTASSGKPDSSTDVTKITTEEPDSEATTGGSGMETTTEDSGSEATTGDSGMGSKTRKPKKKRRKTTTASSGKPDSSTDVSKIRTEGPGSGAEGNGPEITENPDTGSTTESTDELHTTTEEESESTSTTKTSTTTRRTKRPRTTTRRRRRTTSASGKGPTGGTETTTLSEGSSCTTTTDNSENTTDSTVTTTEQKSTTMRVSCAGDFNAEPGCDKNCTKRCPGPKPTECKCFKDSCRCKDDFVYDPKVNKCVRLQQCSPSDCKGKHERYFPCAPSCPQQTCGDYLNGVKCSENIRLPKCKPECRCLIGYYKDVEGNCLSTRECRRWARSMATSTTTGKLNNQDTTAASTLTMMSTTPGPNCAEVAKELFIKGNLAYTVKLLSDLSERNPDNNVLVGGASILYLFAQLALEAKNTVKTETLKVFNLPDIQHVRCFFPEISALLTAKYPDIEYSLFCRTYADVGYALTDDFIRRTTQLFAMGPENLDFSSSEAAQKINSDVAQYTNDHFLNYVKPRTLLSLDGLVLVDAEGFKGKWENQFDSANTIMKDFYSPDRVEKIATMYQRGIFLFRNSAILNSKILKLRYRGGRFSLVIILPNSNNGIKDLLRRMENPSNIASELDKLKYEKVNVHLPKFNVSVANILKMSSEMAGLKEIFNKTTRGLEDIGSKKPPYVGEILQRLNFAVNEHGMGDKDVDFPEPEIPRLPKFANTQTFKADHPFVYFTIFDELVFNAGLLVN